MEKIDPINKLQGSSLPDATRLSKLKSHVVMAYLLSSNSMKKFTGVPVLSNVPKLELSELSPEITNHGSGDPEEMLYVVATDIIGELSCKSFWVLTEKEAKQIVSMVSNKTGMGKDMPEEVLKESDNMLAAGVATYFSNLLKRTIYGGVPILSKVKAGDLNEFIKDNITSLDFDVADSDYYLSSKTNLMFYSLHNVKPAFIWIFPSEFTELLK